MSTKEKLVTELTNANAPEWMVKNARNGQYDDFESTIATSCVQLVADCRSVGLEAFAQRAIDGEFDATKEESDAWYEREGKGVIGDIFGSATIRNEP